MLSLSNLEIVSRAGWASKLNYTNLTSFLLILSGKGGQADKNMWANENSVLALRLLCS